MNDELIGYIQDCIKNNKQGTLPCQMALLAEQAIIQSTNFSADVESITDVSE